MMHVYDWMAIVFCAWIVACVLWASYHYHRPESLGDQAERLAQDARAQEDDE